MNIDETYFIQLEALDTLRIGFQDIPLEAGDRLVLPAGMERFGFCDKKGGIRILPFPEPEFVDERVYDLIKEHPGFRYKELLRYAKMKAETVKASLGRLQKRGLIRWEPEGKTFLLFPEGVSP